MKIIYSARHRVHHGEFESHAGRLVQCYEKPERADLVLAAVTACRIGPVLEPEPFPLTPIERVHAPRYLHFLEHAWEAWSALGNTREAFPDVWPIRGFRHDIEPGDFIGQLGLYSFDTGTPLTAGAWVAARLSAETALTAQRVLSAGESAAFALTRPPGHHAGSDFFGGYCFLNNAAVAAQALLDDGAHRVAILDVDYHHGNGTQSIFYDRADVLVLSIHGDPRTEYPYYLGHADETGRGAGEGFNHNYPLPAGSSNEVWFEALDAACNRIRAYGPDTLVVALGVDTYVRDPLSKFALDGPEYLKLGTRLAAMRLPTLFVLEGGYGVPEMGANVASVLRGFEDAGC
ncbi:MAG TPA: histone deacetylase family protein [Burkholderiaceae bacterium]|nr:histone deacetylase family protein [Burkholderiaceae bacterium]